MAELKISNLKKTYDDHLILKGIDLRVHSGEFVSLLGPSGSGKTTILRCLAGLEKPDSDSGNIEVDEEVLSGKNIFLPPEKRNLGMVFQSYAVWPHMTVYENVSYPLVLRSKKGLLTKNEMKDYTETALKKVKLNGLEKRLPHQLSGGQQQRVALARAIAMAPKLLLLDEPLSNLDTLLRDELGSEIRRLQQEEGWTVILVTHDQKEALSLSDRIVLLNQGKIDSEGQPEKLFYTPPTDFCAKFISGAVYVHSTPPHQGKTLIPRRWKVDPAGETSARICSRIFLGSEYEYWVSIDQFEDRLKIFSHEYFSSGDSVKLTYQENTSN